MENEDRIVLPLNKTPSIRTCIHYAYPLAIIESRELGIITIKNYYNWIWNEKTEDTSIHIDENTIKVLEEVSGGKPEAVLWRHCNKEDEVVININYLKTRDTTRYVDVFLFADDLYTQIKQEGKTCGVRWNPYGFFIEKNMYTYDTKIYRYLKLSIEADCFMAYASKDGIQWKYIERKEIPSLYKAKTMRLGIHMYFGKDYYKIWRSMNFIQLIYNSDSIYKGIIVDYYFSPRKNYHNCYNYYNNYLDIHYDLLYDALDCFNSLHEYIRWNIRHLYYLEMCLDEFYVTEREQYNKSHYNHYNLFYGYDDKKRVYYIMGYGVGSIPVVSELPYDIINQYGITSEKIIRYRYNMNEVTGLKLNIDAIKTGLYELLNDVDSSEKVANLMTEEKVQYGLSIIKQLACDEVGKKFVCVDRRIAFLFTEHSRLMSERLDFLYENGYLSKDDYFMLDEKCADINKQTTLILRLVMRNALRKKEDNKIESYLIDYYEKEKDFLELFLKCLDKV